MAAATAPWPLRLAALIALPLAIAGCSSIPWLGGEKDPTPPTELEDFVAEVGLTTLWSERVTRGGEGKRLRLVPAVGGGRVYVADARGRLVAVDASSGRVQWQRDTDLAFSGGPDLERDRLILGTTGGQVVALSNSDGREIWRTQLESEVLSVPRATNDGRVIVHTLDDSIYGLDGANGAELWRLNYPAPALTLRGSSSPAVTPSGVVVGLSGGKLVKVDPLDGAPLWEVTVTPPRGRSELARIADIDADPVVIGNVVFTGTYNGDLAAVDLETGTVLWRRQLSSYAGLGASESNLFVTDSDDQIWGADPVSGAGFWKQERLRFRQLTAPAVLGRYIVVGDLEGYLHVVSQGDGRLVGRTRMTKKGPIFARPVADAGRLFVYGNDGTLAAFTLGSAPAPSRRAMRNQADDAGEASAAVPAEDTLAPDPIGTGSDPAPSPAP
jgi:outer membrane protein assembly factor BamB